MEEVPIEFTFKARYYKLGNVTEQTRQLWFVLHGYGQLARYFLRNFESLGNHNICVIAPEGLSRFYLEDIRQRAASGNNRVGATWMTAENRQADIENYLHYLTGVHKKVMQGNPKVPVTLLGFSQGAATASRWVLHYPDCCNRLILWAGIFPPDIDFEKAKEVLNRKSPVMVYGLRDPYVTDIRLEEMTSISGNLGVVPRVVTFNGAHEIDEATLLRLI